MGKKYSKNINLKFDDVCWFLIDGTKVQPAIINYNKTKLKLILTGQIIEGEEDFNLNYQNSHSFNDILHTQEECVKAQLNCENFTCFNSFDNLYYYLQNFYNGVSFLDTIKSTIAKDFFRTDGLNDDSDPHFKRYTLKDYDDFTSILEKMAKKREKRRLEEEKNCKNLSQVQKKWNHSKIFNLTNKFHEKKDKT